MAEPTKKRLLTTRQIRHSEEGKQSKKERATYAVWMQSLFFTIGVTKEHQT